MPNFALIVLTGHLGKDMEVSYLSDGKPVGRFSIAVSTGYGDRKVSSWYRCTIWGDRAEKLKPFLLKGKTVAIVGRVSARAYDSKGEARASLEVRVDQLTLLGGGERREERAPAAHPTDDWI